jgi:galactokinase
MDIAEFKSRFEALYGEGDVRVFFSPSRVNLIGEHIDYNGGYVMPCALQLGTYGCVRKTDNGIIRLASENFDLKVEVNIDDLKYRKEDDWANYPKGVMYILKEEGYEVSGMDILINGNIPNGAGLSSSASLELLIGEMVNNLFNEGKISRVDLVKICQRAENEFIGVKCGIMDQFAVCMGKNNKGILLNCNTLDYNYVDIDIKDYVLVIMNTNKRRQLNESKYNERREECEKALSILKRYKDIDYLCELKIEEYDELEKYINDQIVRNRARHVVYENERVLKAYDSMERGDLQTFGELLIESHNSLRDLYQVTGKELDTIVDAAINHKDCVGARMTGAGFGGCAIALVKKDSVEDFIDIVGATYKSKIGYEADFYMTGIGDGTKELVSK